MGQQKVGGLGGDTSYLEQQAAALVAVDCKTGLLCRMDTLVNLVFLLFDKRHVQLQLVNLFYKKMDDVLFSW